jgi:hypothetical protein
MSTRIKFKQTKCAGGTLPIRAKKKFKSGYNEIWKDLEFKYQSISGRKYMFSNLGRIASFLEDINKDGVIIEPSPRKTSLIPYLEARLNTFQNVEVNGKLGKIRLTDTVILHKLIAQTFIPNDDVENKTEIIHLDGDVNNNQFTNLIWATKEEYKKAIDENPNINKSKRLVFKGRKLTTHQARKLKTLVLEGKLKKSTLAKMFGLNLIMIYRVEYGVYLKYVKPYTEEDPDPTTKKPIA